MFETLGFLWNDFEQCYGWAPPAISEQALDLLSRTFAAAMLLCACAFFWSSVKRRASRRMWGAGMIATTLGQAAVFALDSNFMVSDVSRFWLLPALTLYLCLTTSRGQASKARRKLADGAAFLVALTGLILQPFIAPLSIALWLAPWAFLWFAIKQRPKSRGELSHGERVLWEFAAVAIVVTLIPAAAWMLIGGTTDSNWSSASVFLTIYPTLGVIYCIMLSIVQLFARDFFGKRRGVPNHGN